jgi:hypothetical protein
MDVDHVDRVPLQQARQVMSRAWMDGELERQVRHHSVNAQAVHRILAP